MKIKNEEKKYPGMTIIEMLVAIGIFTMGIAGFTMLFARVWQGNSYTLEMGQSSMAVSEGMNKMINYVRGSRQADNGSYSIVSADDNDLVLYADYDKDNSVERLHFYKEASGDGFSYRVKMGIRESSAGFPKTYAAGDQTTTVIAERIVNGPGSPIFLYFDKNYAGGAGQNPLDTPASVPDIRLVKIYLQINIDPNRAPDNIQMQSFVELRNLNDYNKIE